MIINRANLQGLYTGFKVIFQNAFAGAQPQYQKIATLVPSSTSQENYKWLGDIPGMREWIGERVIQNLSAHDYTIKNKDFELTIGIDRNDIEDDTLGLYNPMMQQMGYTTALHPDEIVFPLLGKGFTTECYDKVTFFGAHKIGKKSYTNKGTKKLTPAAYEAARAFMLGILKEDGTPCRITPNLLVVPPQLESAAKRILFAETDELGKTNINKGTAELLVLPELASTPEYWFLLDVSKPIKPLIFQQRKKPVFESKINMSDDNVFFEKKYIYGVDSRDNAGYGLWQLAYGSTGEEA